MIRKLPTQLQGPAKHFFDTGRYKHYGKGHVGERASDKIRKDIETSVVSIMAADNSPQDRNRNLGVVDTYDPNLGNVKLEFGRKPYQYQTQEFYLEAPEPLGKFVAYGTQKRRGLDLVFATTSHSGAVIFDGAIHTDRSNGRDSYISLPPHE